jgi:formate dehydrogenase major subunit
MPPSRARPIFPPSTTCCPGTWASPTPSRSTTPSRKYIETEFAPTGWWSNYPKYIISLLKAWYGDRARVENGFCFDHVPRITGDHSQLPMTQAIHDGTIKGLFLMGQNPAVGGHNTRFVRRGLANLEWLVVRDPYETESASFWYDSPEVKNGELNTGQIKTEVFLLPAAITGEKDGSYTNTHRLVQWHDKAVEPPGDARSEPWFMYHLGRRLRELYAKDPEQGSMRVRQILDLAWDYPTTGPTEDPELERVLLEINGFKVADGAPVQSFQELQDDGSTACGCWLYSGVMPEPGVNLSRNRQPDPPGGPGTHLNWGFSWPANRRILYNRASADPSGKPWSEQKKYMWWNGEEGEWTGHDVPDFPRTKSPDYRPDYSQKPRAAWMPTPARRHS